MLPEKKRERLVAYIDTIESYCTSRECSECPSLVQRNNGTITDPDVERAGFSRINEPRDRMASCMLLYNLSEKLEHYLEKEGKNELSNSSWVLLSQTKDILYRNVTNPQTVEPDRKTQINTLEAIKRILSN